jgi:hypothetical protein
MSIPFKCEYVVVTPVPATDVPNNSLFVDSSAGNAFSTKNSGGTPSVLATSAGDNPFLKTMETNEEFPLYAPLVKLPNGRIAKADSNNINTESFCGYAMSASSGAGLAITVMCAGPNIPGALEGLGFTPGDLVYINEGGGYTNDPSTFTGDDDTLVKVGLADCAGGPSASPIATDLIATYEFIAGI